MKEYNVHLTSNEGELLKSWKIQIFAESEDEKFCQRLLAENPPPDVIDIAEAELNRKRGPFLLLEELAEAVQLELQTHFNQNKKE